MFPLYIPQWLYEVKFIMYTEWEYNTFLLDILVIYILVHLQLFERKNVMIYDATM